MIQRYSVSLSSFSITYDFYYYNDAFSLEQRDAPIDDSITANVTFPVTATYGEGGVSTWYVNSGNIGEQVESWIAAANKDPRAFIYATGQVGLPYATYLVTTQVLQYEPLEDGMFSYTSGPAQVSVTLYYFTLTPEGEIIQGNGTEVGGFVDTSQITLADSVEYFSGAPMSPVTYPGYDVIFPKYIDFLLTEEVFTPNSDRVDLSTEISSITVTAWTLWSSFDAKSGNDRVVLPDIIWADGPYDFDQTFLGGAGNDTIIGRNGADVIDGGIHNDRLLGGANSDRLAGAAGSDSAFGGVGSDSIHGENGDDEIEGGDGSDNLYGGLGFDAILGDAGFDRLFGGDDADVLSGGVGSADEINGDAGDDQLFIGRIVGLYDDTETHGGHLLDGGAGNDLLNASSGNVATADTLFGGTGNDAFYVGDLDRILDFSPEDRIWMWNGGTADLVTVTREVGRTHVTFHDASLNVISELFIAGNHSARDFTVHYQLDGLVTEIALGQSVQAGAKAQKGFWSLFADGVSDLFTAPYPVQYEIRSEGLQTLFEEGLDKVLIDPTLSKLPSELLGKLIKGIAGIVPTMLEHMMGEYDGHTETQVVAEYVKAASMALLASAAGISLGPMVLIGAGYLLTQKLVEVGIDAYFDAAKAELLRQADPANIDNSQVFRRVHEGTPGADSSQGGSGQDRITTGADNDTLAGLGGQDLLQGGRGKDQLTGGAGADEFYFAANRNGNDVVRDFGRGSDRLVFDGLTQADLEIEGTGGGTKISWLGGSVRLNSVDVSTLDASSFDFV